MEDGLAFKQSDESFHLFLWLGSPPSALPSHVPRRIVFVSFRRIKSSKRSKGMNNIRMLGMLSAEMGTYRVPGRIFVNAQPYWLRCKFEIGKWMKKPILNLIRF